MRTKHDGGSIESLKDSSNIADVEYLTTEDEIARGQKANWKVSLNGLLRKKNFIKGDLVMYNYKGTNNSNADNCFIVENVLGPGLYICRGESVLNA